MSAESITARELKSLQDELSAAQHASQERLQPAAPLEATEPPRETSDLPELRDQLRELADEVSRLFAEAESNIAAHPAQSVIGALLVGILIGRLLPAR
jgi:ElaB/YqjD/DUF883 family membrane-anchored ribosome-binding protein